MFHSVSCLLIRNNHASLEKLCFSPRDYCSSAWGSLMPVTCTNCLYQRGLLAWPQDTALQILVLYKPIQKYLIGNFQSFSAVSISDPWLQAHCWLLVPSLMSAQEFIQTFPTHVFSGLINSYASSKEERANKKEEGVSRKGLFGLIATLCQVKLAVKLWL